MHIRVDRIILSKLDFELFPNNIKEQLPASLGIECHNAFSPDEKQLIQTIDFDLARGVENPPFKLIFSFTALYSCEGEGTPSLREFAEFNAPAYVIPYAREIIANITSRIGIVPTLVIPPINIYRLMEELRKEESDGEPSPDDQCQNGNKDDVGA